MNLLFRILLISTISLFNIQIALASHSVKNIGVNQAKLDADIKKLQNTWTAYKANVEAMNQALPSIKQEKDANKRNASVSIYTQKLEQTKHILNQLVLPQTIANQLRQQIIEHATKYQGVYKLAAIDNLSTTQLNAFNRLDRQTTSLYNQMLDTAEQVVY